MNLANRLNRLEKRLGPRLDLKQASPTAILLAIALTPEQLTYLGERLEARDRGECLEDTPEMQEIYRRTDEVKEELNRESMPQKIAGELKMSPNRLE